MRRRSIALLADDTGSVLDLGMLTSIVDAYGAVSGAGADARWSTLKATDGGSILAPALAELRGVDVTLDGTGSLNTAQLQSVISGRLLIDAPGYDFSALADATGAQVVVIRVHAEFPALTTLRFGTVSLANGGTVGLPNLVDIDGASLFVSGGVTLALPHLVGGDGILATIPVTLDPSERDALARSAAILRSAIESLSVA